MDDLLLLETTLPEESKLMRLSVQQFVREKILPTITAKFEQAQFAAELIPQLAQLGLFGITLPEKLGGSGASYLTYGVVCQELERGDSAWRSFVSVQNSLVIFPLAQFGSHQQHQTWLAKLVSGAAVGCFGLTEPDSGSDPSSMRTTAVVSQGGWLLNGAKMWITSAPIADMAIVWAKTHEGIRGFIVEKEREGFVRREIHHKYSLRASPTGELIFNNCWIPEENLLPNSSKGLACALQCLTQARFGIAWGVMGAAKACFERTLAYVKDRKQFSKPLASFQLIQKDLVEMMSEIVKADCVNYRLAQLKDAGQATPEMVSFAKRNACRQALSIARSCRNLLGANGISLEYDVIRHMNNLESVFTYEGTDNVHTLILGKYLTGISAFS